MHIPLSSLLDRVYFFYFQKGNAGRFFEQGELAQLKRTSSGSLLLDQSPKDSAVSASMPDSETPQVHYVTRVPPADETMKQGKLVILLFLSFSFLRKIFSF